jgi:hypothetical protein
MKKIIFLLSLILTQFDTTEVEYIKMGWKDSMDVMRLEQDIYNIKATLWVEGCVSLFSHSLGLFYMASTNGLKNSDNLSSFLLFNTIGVGVDIYTVAKICKIRKKKKEIKLIKSKYYGG